MKSRRDNAFSLVEVSLALGVAAFCIVALFGLLPVGLNSNMAAIQQTAATSLAASVASDLRSDLTGAARNDLTNAPSPRFGFKRAAAAKGLVQSVYVNEDGSIAAGPTTAMYRLTVVITPPALATHRTASSARVLVTWPAIVDASPTVMPSKYSGVFETVISLDRN